MTFSAVAAAVASVGTGVGAAAIVLAKPAHPGQRYRLPNVYVVNTGTQRTAYAARVQRLRPFSHAQGVPAGWIRFARRTVTLNPGQAIYIALTLVLPGGAHPGAYASDVVVNSVAGGKGFARIGTGAATALRFTVTRFRRHR